MDFYTSDDFLPDQSIGYLVKMCGQQGTAILDRAFAVDGLTCSQWSALISIHFDAAPTCASLARDLVHDKGAMTRMMDVLEARGWVERTRSAEDLLELVGLDPKRTLESYPHELSGGQRQRVLIAMALTRDPKLIIADEPTTALDVTVQKQVIALLNELREKLGFAMIFVSHDLALVAEVAHHITVMYAGQVIEQAPTKELLTHPTHEYTRGLLGAVLSIESGSGRLHQVPGTVPSPRDFPVGDRFAPRSSHPDYGLDIRPVLTEVGPEHVYAALPPREEVLVASEIIIEEGQEEQR